MSSGQIMEKVSAEINHDIISEVVGGAIHKHYHSLQVNAMADKLLDKEQDCAKVCPFCQRNVQQHHTNFALNGVLSALNDVSHVLDLP